MARTSGGADLEPVDPDAAPLTVAAVARTLGVAASTLRTWDRRYGLGPSSHQAGSHRRYTPEDVARLQTMRRLTLRGVAPADAARIATQSSEQAAAPVPQEAAPDDESLVLDPLTLAAAAIEPDLRRTHRMLRRAVREDGVLQVWSELVTPALEMIDTGRHRLAERPGSDPAGTVVTAFLQAVREIALTAPARVRILAAAQERLAAHVLAGGLAEREVSAVVVAAERVPDNGDLTSWLPERTPALAVVGNPPGADAVVSQASERGDVEIFLLGPTAPDLWLPKVHRVRTAHAAVAEIVAALDDRTHTTGAARET